MLFAVLSNMPIAIRIFDDFMGVTIRREHAEEFSGATEEEGKMGDHTHTMR